ncbi:MAG: insulinase family protein, partial [Bacteroidales bacterium]|nr:insulinase family protein [Bacteroidales bacterium]
MKKFSLILGMAVMMLSSCTNYESVSGDPLGTKVYTLDNGLKVFMSVNKETPRIQTYIAVKVGGKNDPSETTGLAHYFEHLMFKGSQQFGTSDYEAEKPLLDQIEALFETYRVTTDEAERAAIYHQIDSISYEASKIAIPNEYDKLMSLIGSQGTNAWTSHDETVYVENIPSNQIDNWARIEADRFKNVVIRGFHTELETIYEEKNMSLTQDSRKLWAALDNGLFPHHPYGNQTVLGTQEHLKNPSITNVKKYHDNYYVPNNIAICLSGDFDPDQMVKTIEKYFGDWEPNPNIPVLQYEKEQPITSPVVKEVYGLEAENIALGWRLPEAKDVRNSAIAEIASSVLSNGQAGLIDLDVNQQQKTLSASAGAQIQPDYSSFLAMGRPKQGQTLDEVKDILLAEVAKLRAGDFDEELIPSTINNIRLGKMRQLEDNQSRARIYIDAFINGVDWKVAVKELDIYKEVTKEDVVKWANEFLGDSNYVVVYKRQGEDKTVQKISAPKITPIESNRNMQSAFLVDMANHKVDPIEPVYVNFDTEMSQFDLNDKLNVLYKQNTTNDICNLSFEVNKGIADDPALDFAIDYISYLGTPSMTAEEIASKLYGLACDFRAYSGTYKTSLTISGLGENMVEAMNIAQDLINNAVGDEAILAQLKADALKSRANAVKSQRTCYAALQKYLANGPEYIKATTLSNAELMNLTSEELLAKVKEVFTYGQEVTYYGPLSVEEISSVLKENYNVNPSNAKLPEKHNVAAPVEKNEVFLVQYDAKQLYYKQYRYRDEKFNPETERVTRQYNNYVGGGMYG